MQGAWVQSLIRELDPQMLRELDATSKSLHTAIKDLHATTKTESSQITKLIIK